MSDHYDTQHSPEVDFSTLFTEAEKTTEFWVSKAKYQFTEEMLRELTHSGYSKALLAEKMDVNPAFISRLCKGSNNFTMTTMVKVAQALDCELYTHLVPKGRSIQWIDFLHEEPEESADWKINRIKFQPVGTVRFEEIINGRFLTCQR